jgi:type IV secretion system protein VirB6
MPVENNAPVAAVLKMIDDHLLTGVSTAAHAISDVITPIAAACFGIYMILIVVHYMRGASAEPVWDFLLRMAGFSIVIGLGLNAGNYVDYVVPMVMGLGNDLAAAVSGGDPNANVTALDTMIQNYARIIFVDIDQLEMGFANYENFIVFSIKTLIIIIAILPFAVFAAALLVIAKAGAALITAVGPLFFACLIFPATRQYFSAWMNAALSYALLPVFIAIIAMMTINLSQTLFSTQDGVPYMTFMDVFMAAIVNLLLIYLLKTCQSLAFSLGAGGINAGFSAGSAYNNAGNAASRTVAVGGARIYVNKAAEQKAAAVAAAMKNMIQNGIKPG